MLGKVVWTGEPLFANLAPAKKPQRIPVLMLQLFILWVRSTITPCLNVKNSATLKGNKELKENKLSGVEWCRIPLWLLGSTYSLHQFLMQAIQFNLLRPDIDKDNENYVSIYYLYGFTPLCDLLWRASSSDLEKRQPHCGQEQEKGFSPVCLLICALRWLDLA